MGKKITGFEIKRRARIEQGFCQVMTCPNRAEPGHLVCAEHLKYYRERSREKYWERRRAGLCVVCGQRAMRGLSMCAACREKRRTQTRRRQPIWYRERKLAGLCPRCGRRPDVPGRVLCSACNQKLAEQRAARKSRQTEAAPELTNSFPGAGG